MNNVYKWFSFKREIFLAVLADLIQSIEGTERWNELPHKFYLRAVASDLAWEFQLALPVACPVDSVLSCPGKYHLANHPNQLLAIHLFIFISYRFCSSGWNLTVQKEWKVTKLEGCHDLAVFLWWVKASFGYSSSSNPRRVRPLLRQPGCWNSREIFCSVVLYSKQI